MNEILASVYGAILPAAPFVIAAYVLVLIVLCIFGAAVVRGLKKSEADITRLEYLVDRLCEERKQEEE